MRLWGRINSINVQKVVWALEEIGLPYERVEAGMEHGGVDTDAYLALNPNGRVPTFVDGDVVLWESNTIVRFLGREYSLGRHWPGEPAAASRGESWMDWQLGALQLPMRTAFWGLIRTAPDERKALEINGAMSELHAQWLILERHLRDRPFVTADRFTLSDIPLGCFWSRYARLGGRADDLPSCRNWYERLRTRPAASVLQIPLT